MQFPPSFTWGVAASACQIEGAAAADGKGPSVWDNFASQPGKVALGHTPAVACDHYRRFRADVAMMRDLGIRTYRLSLSWPRILPQGTGAVNPAGLDFYDALIDALLEASITPWVTLFHWDFPLALMQRGGWLNRDAAAWFGDYTTIVARKLSDRVRHWLTLNEPQCFIGFGHLTGTNAPGLRLPLAEALRAGHHVLLAHGTAVQALRSHCQLPPTIGWAPVGVVSIPHDPHSPADIEAARVAMASCSQFSTPSPELTAPVWSNAWWADPVVFGHYPEDGVRLAGTAMPTIQPGDLELISQPIDFYGANIYSAQRVQVLPDGSPGFVPHPQETPLSAFQWPIVPECLHWGPRLLHERYHLPVVVTENGISLADAPSADGAVHDPVRCKFIDDHLQQLSLAISHHTEIHGYFHWSLMDNFEWAEGYQQRFGLVHVDYTTQQRTLKDSAYHYAAIIRTQSACG